MTAKELQKKQDEMFETIRLHAQRTGLIKKKPIIEPIYDGITDIQGYLASNPKIMWILKEPYDDFTITGRPKGGNWSFTEHFQNDDVWKDEDMWKLMIQINYAIHNDLKWKELDYIEKNPEMAEELRRTAYINVGKMPAEPTSPNNHMQDCYIIWKDILFEQIKLYKPDVIIFGYTFYLFKEDLGITDKPVSTVAGQWFSNFYRKNDMILIDAYHPSRKGGEDGSHDYVTSIINAYKKAIEK